MVKDTRRHEQSGAEALLACARHYADNGSIAADTAFETPGFDLAMDAREGDVRRALGSGRTDEFETALKSAATLTPVPRLGSGWTGCLFALGVGGEPEALGGLEASRSRRTALARMLLADGLVSDKGMVAIIGMQGAGELGRAGPSRLRGMLSRASLRMARAYSPAKGASLDAMRREDDRQGRVAALIGIAIDAPETPPWQGEGWHERPVVVGEARRGVEIIGPQRLHETCTSLAMMTLSQSLSDEVGMRGLARRVDLQATAFHVMRHHGSLWIATDIEGHGTFGPCEIPPSLTTGYGESMIQRLREIERPVVPYTDPRAFAAVSAGERGSLRTH